MRMHLRPCRYIGVCTAKLHANAHTNTTGCVRLVSSSFVSRLAIFCRSSTWTPTYSRIHSSINNSESSQPSYSNPFFFLSLFSSFFFLSALDLCVSLEISLSSPYSHHLVNNLPLFPTELFVIFSFKKNIFPFLLIPFLILFLPNPRINPPQPFRGW